MAGSPAKKRIDHLLVERGLAESRTRAQAYVMAGLVFSGERRIEKSGQQLPEDCAIELRGQDHPWVSRGGLKLAHAIELFKLPLRGLTCIDVGSSTGGFSDVMLTNGAHKVYAVDVGRGQLAWKLRQDDRVVVMEKTNARYLTDEAIADDIGFIGCDASFIGLETVLPAALKLAAPGALAVALIKPQFEVGRGQVGKGGVVRDPDLHAQVCERIKTWMDSLEGWTVLGITESPITGPEGNIEFLIAARFEA